MVGVWYLSRYLNQDVAVIGTRNLPDNVHTLIQNIGRVLVRSGATLHTGNAPGADQDAAAGGNSVNPSMVYLHLPWDSFESDKIVNGNFYDTPTRGDYQEAAEAWEGYRSWSVQELPPWDGLKQGTQRLQARTARIIRPSKYVFAYPSWKKGQPAGGTAFGIWMAVNYYHTKNVRVVDWTQGFPSWDICSKCNFPQASFECGSIFHQLKAYA